MSKPAPRAMASSAPSPVRPCTTLPGALLVLTLGWLAAASLAVAARPPVLMVLEHTEGGKPVPMNIEAKSGLAASPDKGKPRQKWMLRAGEAIKSDVQPGDRAVSFYQGEGAEIRLLFIVKLRYYANEPGKWTPRFQLNEEPLLMRGPDGRWQPLTTVQGAPNLIVTTGAALPNAEGYYPYLEFGFTTGATSIDAWAVR